MVDFTRLSYPHALSAMMAGQRMRRAGWNGKGMFVFKVDFWSMQLRNAEALEVIRGCELLPFIVMKTADNKLVPWLCSQTDALATDWEAAE